MTLRLFEFPLCLILLQILMLYLNNILLFLHIQANLYLKLTGFRSDISMGSDSKGLRLIEDF